ncbi:MAG: VWA domain-containing protein [Acidobacteriota bacterium]
MHLADGEALHLLWLIPVLIGFLSWNRSQRRKALCQFAEPALIRHLVSGISGTRRLLKQGLTLGVLCLTFLALARPQWGSRLENVKRTGVDVMIALDTSLSMETRDIAPNRLEKAKHEVKTLIDTLQGDRAGLVVFAGLATVSCPLTIDQNAVKLFLDIADPQLIPRPGTNIGEAIRVATKAFQSEERRHKVLILVTDGESLEGDPLDAAEQARDQGVVVFTIGVGTAAGEPIPLRDEKGTVVGYKKDEAGNVVVSRLGEDTLEKVASLTGGKYHRATTSEAEIEEIYSVVAQMDKKEFQSTVYLTYVDRFQIPLGMAILLLLSEMLISEVRPSGSGTGWLAALLSKVNRTSKSPGFPARV